MHIKRRRLVSKVQRRLHGRIASFGRPHRPIEYKEDAILPYRFHLCIENTATRGLWTEKISDALLGFAIPIYDGCPDISDYFGEAVIRIDVNNPAAACGKIESLLTASREIYRERLPALLEARRRLIEEFDMATLIRSELGRADLLAPARPVDLRAQNSLPFARVRDGAARLRRRAVSVAMHWSSNLHG
jgi:hypothetical protein